MTATINHIEPNGWWNRYDGGYEFVIDEAVITLLGQETKVEGTLFFFPTRQPQIQIRCNAMNQRGYNIEDAEAKRELTDAALAIVGERIEKLGKRFKR